MQQLNQPTLNPDQTLVRAEQQALQNRRTGLALFQLSWILVFVSLIVANWQLRYQYASWPPPGVEKLGLFWSTLATGLLLLSAFLVRQARQAVEVERLVSFHQQWRVAISLGAMFVVIMALEWLRVSIETQYGIVFRVMTAFHGVHALVIGGYMIRVQQRLEKDFWPVEAATKLWYFVVTAWILFYLVLYWL